MFFRGYVLTQDKKCLEKFKGINELKSYNQVKLLPEFAGILDENTILIDIDNFEQSEILFELVELLNINCRVYKTTRGKHFLFKNMNVEFNKTDTMLAIGLKADIKLGIKNSYSILKFDGIEREILRDVKGDEADPLPKWLNPIKYDADFLDMVQGDGRNQALFNYILTLQGEGFKVEESRECIKLINKYVLKEPLSDAELEVVLRDEAFKKPTFFVKGTFQHDKFAMYLKNNLNIIKIEDVLHFYKDGLYINGYKKLASEMIKGIPSLNRAKRKEVYDYLDDLIIDNEELTSANLIAFKNGLYNIETGQLIPFDPTHIIKNRIPWDYNPKAYYKKLDDVMNKISCNDPAIRQSIEEMTGACFYRSPHIGGGKAFILTGDKSNGKSTFLKVLEKTLGKENISALDLSEVNERFSRGSLFGKLANIGDDIGDNFIPESQTFKKLVTGQSLKGEFKGQDEFFFTTYAKLIFSANNIPRIGRGKDSAAVARRIVIIPFDAEFSPDDPDYDPYIEDRLKTKESIEYLILLGLKALKRVIYNRKFSESVKSKIALREYEVINNPILDFFELTELNQIVNENTRDVYRLYQGFCINNNLQPLSNIEFSRQVKKHYNIDIVDKKIKGVKIRMFTERIIK